MSNIATNRNVRNAEFRKLFSQLTGTVQEAADRAFERFEINPNHESLNLHQLEDHHRGSHRPGSWSVTFHRKYRVIFWVDEPEETNVWYWIGSHADYDHFTGNR
jgi:hypothetical protein